MKENDCTPVQFGVLLLLLLLPTHMPQDGNETNH